MTSQPTTEEPLSSAPPAERFGTGVLLALVSAASFGLSGPLASGLLDAGWTPTLAVALRITLGALALLVPAVHSLHGRWHLVARHARVIVWYGVLAVALPQACYFFAIQRLPVGPALLIEYIAPIVVIAWLWATQGQRPTRLTTTGAAVAMVGLVAVLGLTTATPLDPVGVLWASGSLVGAASYFVISARDDLDLPPLALAAGGLVVGAVLLWALGATVLPLGAGAAVAPNGGGGVASWLALGALGLISAALAYAAGVAASRRLGSRLASFLGLSEVVSAFLYAWALLGQVPTASQLVGALGILGGVVLVKLGEPR